MSFLTKTALRTSRAVSVQAPRQFSTSIAARKTISETAKDTLKTVDRKVSDKLVDGINVSCKYLMIQTPLFACHSIKLHSLAATCIYSYPQNANG
jgi:hypothetical protein